MSQCASSSASSAARPPRAKRPTALPTRPPIASRRRSPAPSRPRARRASCSRHRRSGSFGASSVVDAEPAPIVGGEIDAAEREVARDVLEEVHELEPGADVVRPGDELRLVRAADHAEHEPPDRVGRVCAVAAQRVPRLVLGDALIHAVRLDQPEERLLRQIARRESSAASSRITGQLGAPS